MTNPTTNHTTELPQEEKPAHGFPNLAKDLNEVHRRAEARTLLPEDVEALVQATHFFTAADALQYQKLTSAADFTGHTEPSLFTAKDSSPVEEHLTHLNHLVFCVITMTNGQRVVGINYGAINPTKFSLELAKTMARRSAMDKVWEFAGCLLREDIQAYQRYLDTVDQVARAFAEEEKTAEHKCGGCASCSGSCHSEKPTTEAE